RERAEGCAVERAAAALEWRAAHIDRASHADTGAPVDADHAPESNAALVVRRTAGLDRSLRGQRPCRRAQIDAAATAARVEGANLDVQMGVHVDAAAVEAAPLGGELVGNDDLPVLAEQADVTPAALAAAVGAHVVGLRVDPDVAPRGHHDDATVGVRVRPVGVDDPVDDDSAGVAREVDLP